MTVPPHDERGNTIAASLARRGIVPASTGGVDLYAEEEDEEENSKENSIASQPRADTRRAFAPAGPNHLLAWHDCFQP